MRNRYSTISDDAIPTSSTNYSSIIPGRKKKSLLTRILTCHWKKKRSIRRSENENGTISSPLVVVDHDDVGKSITETSRTSPATATITATSSMNSSAPDLEVDADEHYNQDHSNNPNTECHHDCTLSSPQSSALTSRSISPSELHYHTALNGGCNAPLVPLSHHFSTNDALLSLLDRYTLLDGTNHWNYNDRNTTTRHTYPNQLQLRSSTCSNSTSASNNDYYSLAYAIGVKYIEVALFTIPQHGYYQREEYTEERRRSLEEALRVAQFLEELIDDPNKEETNIDTIEEDEKKEDEFEKNTWMGRRDSGETRTEQERQQHHRLSQTDKKRDTIQKLASFARRSFDEKFRRSHDNATPTATAEALSSNCQLETSCSWKDYVIDRTENICSLLNLNCGEYDKTLTEDVDGARDGTEDTTFRNDEDVVSNQQRPVEEVEVVQEMNDKKKGEDHDEIDGETTKEKKDRHLRHDIGQQDTSENITSNAPYQLEELSSMSFSDNPPSIRSNHGDSNEQSWNELAQADTQNHDASAQHLARKSSSSSKSQTNDMKNEKNEPLFPPLVLESPVLELKEQIMVSNSILHQLTANDNTAILADSLTQASIQERNIITIDSYDRNDLQLALTSSMSRNSELLVSSEPHHHSNNHTTTQSNQLTSTNSHTISSLSKFYTAQFLSLREKEKVHVRFLDTYQGRIQGSTNGCTVIAPLICIQYFIDNNDCNDDVSSGRPVSWDHCLADEQIVQVIDVQAPIILSEVRNKLNLAPNTFIIPSDVHDHLIDLGLLSPSSFVGVCGGNVLEDDHLKQLKEMLLCSDKGKFTEKREIEERKKVAAAFFFHGHVVALHVINANGSKNSAMKGGFSGGKVWVELIDSLPDTEAWTLPREQSSNIRQSLHPSSSRSSYGCDEQREPLQAGFDINGECHCSDDLWEKQPDENQEDEYPLNAVRVLCMDLDHFDALIRHYALCKFSEEEKRFIDENPWEDKNSFFDPRVFQAFIWTAVE